MPETFNPISWVNDTAPALSATNLNAVMTGIETIDDRTAALERGIATPVVIGYTASITIDAAAGSLFRISATGTLTLAGITNGVDGQGVVVEVFASGAARTVNFGFSSLASITVPVGTWWSAEFRYHADLSSWLLADTSGGQSATGGVISGYIPAGATTTTVVHSLGTKDLLIGVQEPATGLYPLVATRAVDDNTTEFTFTDVPGTTQYRYTIAAKGATLAAPQVRDVPVVQAFATSLTLNAAAGNSRICTATANFTLNDPANGVDGQLLRLRVIASGAQRVLTFAGTLRRPAAMASTLTIPISGRGDIGLYYESAYGWSVLAAQVV